MTDGSSLPASPPWSSHYAAVARDAVVAATLEPHPQLLSVSETAFGIDLFMIRCDGCHRFFHGRCLCIPLSTALMLPSFLCPRCSPQQAAYTAALPALLHPTFLFPPLPARVSSSSSAPDASALDKQGNNNLHRSILLMEDPPSLFPSSPRDDQSASMAALAVMPNRDGYTPMHLAALLHMPSWLQFFLTISSEDSALLPLLSCRTAPFRTTVHTSIFLYELGGNTPLHLACYEGDEETVRVILAASLSSPALSALPSARNDAALTAVDMLLLSPHVPEAKRRALLDSLPLSMQQAAAPSSAERLQLQARQRRRVDVLDAMCRTYGWQGRATRELSLLFYAIEEEETKRRAEDESGQPERLQVEGQQEEMKEPHDAAATCGCGSDCRFRDASFGVMRFVLAGRMQRTADSVTSIADESDENT